MSDFNILFQGKLDEKQTTTNINNQISEIAKHLKELNIDVNINSDSLNKITQAMQNIQKQNTSEINKQNSALKQQKSTLDKIEKFNSVDLQGNRTTTKEIKTQTNELGQEVKQISTLNAETKKLELTSEKITDNEKQKRKEAEKLTKEKEKLLKLSSNLSNTSSYITGDQISGLNTKINSSQNLDELQQARLAYDDLIAKNQILAGVSQTVTNREKEKTKEIANQNKAIYDNAEAERQRIAKLGALVNTFDQLKGSGAEWSQIEKTLQEHYGDSTLKLTKYDEATGKLTYKRRESSKTEREYISTLDKTTGAIHNQSNAIKDISAKNLGIMQQFRIAMERVNCCPLCQ